MTLTKKAMYKVMTIENGEHKFYGEWADKNIAEKNALALWFGKNIRAYVVEAEELPATA